MAKEFWLQQGPHWALFLHTSRGKVHVLVHREPHRIDRTCSRYEAHKLWGNLIAQGYERRTPNEANAAGMSLSTLQALIRTPKVTERRTSRPVAFTSPDVRA